MCFWILTRVTSRPNSNTDGFRLTFSVSFSYISFSSFTFPGAPYRIFLLFFPWLPCHFYLLIIKQQQQQTDNILEELFDHFLSKWFELACNWSWVILRAKSFIHGYSFLIISLTNYQVQKDKQYFVCNEKFGSKIYYTLYHSNRPKNVITNEKTESKSDCKRRAKWVNFFINQQTFNYGYRKDTKKIIRFRILKIHYNDMSNDWKSDYEQVKRIKFLLVNKLSLIVIMNCIKYHTIQNNKILPSFIKSEREKLNTYELSKLTH